MSRRPADAEYIVGIDLEMTGNGPDDNIIEIGGIIMDRDLHEVDSISLVIQTDPRLIHSDVVREMHTRNGLIYDIVLSPLTITEADDRLVTWVSKYTSGEHLPLFGSGVSHFDRYYMKRDLPKFNAYLSYWALDVGVIRRSLQLFGLDISGMDTTDNKTHRALDDIRSHAEEYRRYKWSIRLV